MLKVLRIFIVLFFSVILLGLLFSPFVSLFLPEKLTNRTYFRLLYHVIADRETIGCISDEDKVSRIFDYVLSHTFLQGTPYECKPAESLMSAEAYCDYQARILNALLGALNINSRYVVLFDKSGISPHTTCEVFLGEKWRVYDASLNIIFQDNLGNKLALEELSANPGLIFQQRKMIALKDYDPQDYAIKSAWFNSMFPFPLPPERSTPVILQAHILDRIADGYYKIFKTSFFDFYQDSYLHLKKQNAAADLRLFFMARNYHLAYRYAKALKCYDEFLLRYPVSEYTQDVLFFRAMLYFDIKNFNEAEKSFELIINKYPLKWRSASYYYLGRIYGAVGNDAMSLASYNNVDTLKLSFEVLENLNKNGLRRQ
ncbi:MAG: hypothetical protein PHW54_05210 [Candidatus Omnitrophica bacterium]|jgi:hypothetical protein|nr:hypothetical protein [Candidatus Omnitrophota bacterium]